MVDDHTDESPNDNRGIHLDHGAVALPFSDVIAQEFVNATDKFFKKYLREFMAFERRMKQQSLKLRIAFMVLQRAERQLLKYRAVVFLLQRLGNHLLGVHGVAGA